MQSMRAQCFIGSNWRTGGGSSIDDVLLWPHAHCSEWISIATSIFRQPGCECGSKSGFLQLENEGEKRCWGLPDLIFIGTCVCRMRRYLVRHPASRCYAQPYQRDGSLQTTSVITFLDSKVAARGVPRSDRNRIDSRCSCLHFHKFVTWTNGGELVVIQKRGQGWYE